MSSSPHGQAYAARPRRRPLVLAVFAVLVLFATLIFDRAQGAEPGGPQPLASAQDSTRVGLGGLTEVDAVTLDWSGEPADDFQLQTSADGERWVTVRRITGAAAGEQTYDVSGIGRHLRVLATDRARQQDLRLAGLDVFGRAADRAAPAAAADVVRVAEFLAECPYSHRKPDDPIVLPGMPGASHMHSFFGNDSTDAHSDLTSLQGGRTTCDPVSDLSSYWVPTLYDGTREIEPTGTTFYYLGEGVRDDVIANIQPFPRGLRIIAGYSKATGPDDNSSARWSCLHHGEVPPGKEFVDCPDGSMLESYLDFPQCWNGVDLDSADHKSHMAFPVGGQCPSTHPVPVPKLRQVLRYPVNSPPEQLSLASGRGYTMHGDFFNVWPEDELAQRVRDCINVIVKCGADGTP